MKRPRRRRYTRAAIVAFYAGLREGLFVESPRERHRIEQRLFRANREGRIK